MTSVSPPGDPEALYTDLAPCGGAGADEDGTLQEGGRSSSREAGAIVFGASARHSVMLPPGARVVDYICGGNGATEELLVFQVGAAAHAC